MSELLGKVKGFVRDNNDPENRGQIRCYCPQVMGDVDAEDTWLPWAEPCFPWLGGFDLGDVGPPFTREEQIADFGREYFGVWLEFQHGSPDFPIWTGCFTIAPSSDDANAHIQKSSGVFKGAIGGVIGRSDLPAGSDDSGVNPLTPIASREIRLITRKGRDIIIGVDGGGSILLGASGVSLQGDIIHVNGKPYLVSITEL